jgi:hypothetical protein
MPQDALQFGWQQQQGMQQQELQLAGNAAHLVSRSNSYPGVGGGLSFEGGSLDFEAARRASSLTATTAVAAAAAAAGVTPLSGLMEWNAAFQPSWQQQQQGMQLEGVDLVSRSHSYPGVGSTLAFNGASLSCEGMASGSLLAAAAAGTMPLQAMQQQQGLLLAGGGLGSRSNSYPGIGTALGLDGAPLSFEGVGSGSVLTAAAAAAVAPVGLPSWSGAAAAAAGVRSQQGLIGEASNSSTGRHPSLQGSSPQQLEQQLLRLTITPQGETFYSFEGSTQGSPPLQGSMTATTPAAAAAAAAAPAASLQGAPAALASWTAQFGVPNLQQQQQQQAAVSGQSSGAATPTAAAARALFISDGVEAASAFMAARRHSDMLRPANVTTPGDVMTAGDVSLGSWLHLMQGAAADHAAAAAAVDAAAAAEQAQLLGLGIAAATSPVSFGVAAPNSPVGLLQFEQQQQMAFSTSPTYGYSGSPPAAAAGAAAAGGLLGNVQLYPPPLALQQQQQQPLDFSGQNVVASPRFGYAGSPPAAAAAAAGLLSNAQLLQPIPLPPPPGPSPQQQQQQRELMFELEADVWSSIAESGGWCSVARMSGAELQAQVQQESPLMAMRVRGTVQQLDMVRDLLQLLMQQQQQHHLTHQQQQH